MKLTPQLLVALVVVAVVGVLAVFGTVSGDAAVGVIVSIAGAFGLGVSHASSTGAGGA